jgi:hypothetical protein
LTLVAAIGTDAKLGVARAENASPAANPAAMYLFPRTMLQSPSSFSSVSPARRANAHWQDIVELEGTALPQICRPQAAGTIAKLSCQFRSREIDVGAWTRRRACGHTSGGVSGRCHLQEEIWGLILSLLSRL